MVPQPHGLHIAGLVVCCNEMGGQLFWPLQASLVFPRVVISAILGQLFVAESDCEAKTLARHAVHVGFAIPLLVGGHGLPERIVVIGLHVRHLLPRIDNVLRAGERHDDAEVVGRHALMALRFNNAVAIC